MKNKVKFLRRSEGFDLTQKQLADAVGVSKMTIVNLERGGNCSGVLMLKLSNYFGKEPTEIFELEEVE